MAGMSTEGWLHALGMEEGSVGSGMEEEGLRRRLESGVGSGRRSAQGGGGRRLGEEEASGRTTAATRRRRPRHRDDGWEEDAGGEEEEAGRRSRRRRLLVSRHARDWDLGNFGLRLGNGSRARPVIWGLP